MGFELTMLVGFRGVESNEWKRTGEWVTDDGDPYIGWEEDSDGNPLTTGRREVHFIVQGMLELGKVPDGKLVNLDMKNDDPDVDFVYYLGNGNHAIREDSYGERPKPIPVKEVIAALEDDIVDSGDYRRYLWAVDLLKVMQNSSSDKERLEVLFSGH